MISKEPFSKYYKLNKKCLFRSDHFEIREIVTVKIPTVKKAAKIYRKLELPGEMYYDDSDDNGSSGHKIKIDGKKMVENELKLLSEIDHPNILKV